MTDSPCRSARTCAARGQRGLTLIELMVSMVIGLVVVGAISYLYIGSRGAYRGNESLAHIQEAGRFSMDSITRDIRRAGALGCGTRASVATGADSSGGVAPVPIAAILRPANATAPLTVTETTVVTGFPPASYTPPASAATGWTPPAGAPAYWGGDVLQLQIGYGAPARVSGNPDATALTIPIADNTDSKFAVGDFAVLANCSAAAVFMVTSVTPTTAPAVSLGFANGTSATGGNGIAGGAAPSLVLPQQPGFAYDSHATVLHFDQVTYYLGIVPNSQSGTWPNGQPALYRYSLRSNTAEEIVENIEDLDVVFGVGTVVAAASGPSLQMAGGTFKHAGLMNAADWPNVVSVRVSALVVGDRGSFQPAAAGQTAQSLLFRTDPTASNQSAVLALTAPADTRLRQSFTATASLRDRLQ